MSTFNSVVRRALAMVAPPLELRLSAIRARRTSLRLYAEWGVPQINAQLISHFGSRVLAGPFAGLQLTPRSYVDQIGPYLLGTYEAELNPVWARVLAREYAFVLDVGARFGFYAVALSRRYPDVPVVAVDPDPWARAATREMAAANGAPRVRLLSRVTPEWLARHLPEHALVVSDCEGYERVLFCSRDIPALRSATLVIEVHEHEAPGVTDQLISRFGASHDVTRIPSRTDAAPLGVDLSFLDQHGRNLAAGEARFEQWWLALVPKAAPGE